MAGAIAAAAATRAPATVLLRVGQSHELAALLHAGPGQLRAGLKAWGVAPAPGLPGGVSLRPWAPGWPAGEMDARGCHASAAVSVWLQSQGGLILAGWDLVPAAPTAGPSLEVWLTAAPPGAGQIEVRLQLPCGSEEAGCVFAAYLCSAGADPRGPRQLMQGSVAALRGAGAPAAGPGAAPLLFAHGLLAEVRHARRLGACTRVTLGRVCRGRPARRSTGCWRTAAKWAGRPPQHWPAGSC